MLAPRGVDEVTGTRPGHPGSAGCRMEEAVRAAAVMAEETEEAGGLGRPGRPVNRRSPFFIGLTGAAGVAVTYGLAEIVIKAGSVLILVGMAFFVATGLEPVVAWLTRHRVPRWAGVVIVVSGMLGIAALFLALAIPRLAAEATTLAHALPTYLHRLQNHNSELGRLNAKYGIEQRLEKLVSGHGTSLVGGILPLGSWCSVRSPPHWSWRCSASTS